MCNKTVDSIILLCVCRILWTAGAVAAVGSITYPAISVYVSANASPDQQGLLKNMLFYIALLQS